MSTSVNPALEFLLSDHPAAKQERLWRRLQSTLGNDFDIGWRHATARTPLEDRRLEVAVQYQRRDDFNVAVFRILLEDHVRTALVPGYRYPEHLLGEEAAAQPPLLQVDPDRPFPSARIGALTDDPELSAGRVPPLEMAVHTAAVATGDEMHDRAVTDLVLVDHDDPRFDTPAIRGLQLRYQRRLEEHQRLQRHLTHAEGPFAQLGNATAASMADEQRWLQAKLQELGHIRAAVATYQHELDIGTKADEVDLAEFLRLYATSLPSTAAGNHPPVVGLLQQQGRDLPDASTPKLRAYVADGLTRLRACPQDRAGELNQQLALLQRLQGQGPEPLTRTTSPAADGSLAETRAIVRELTAHQEQRHQFLRDLAGETDFQAAVAATLMLQTRHHHALEALLRAPPAYLSTLEHPSEDAVATIVRYRNDHHVTHDSLPFGPAPEDPFERVAWEEAVRGHLVSRVDPPGLEP